MSGWPGRRTEACSELKARDDGNLARIQYLLDGFEKAMATFQGRMVDGGGVTVLPVYL